MTIASNLSHLGICGSLWQEESHKCANRWGGPNRERRSKTYQDAQKIRMSPQPEVSLQLCTSVCTLA